MAAEIRGVSLVDSLIRRELLVRKLHEAEENNPREAPRKTEKILEAIAYLALNIVTGIAGARNNEEIPGATRELLSHRFKSFDPNPGDGGCQLRALKNWMMVQKEHLTIEFVNLAKECEKARALFMQRHNQLAKGKKVEGTALQFFDATLAKIILSKDQAFLLQCYLLQLLRVKSEVRPNGVILTHTDTLLLYNIEPKIEVLGKYCKTIVDELQSNLSSASVTFIQEEATRMTLFSPIEKESTCKALIHVKKVAGIDRRGNVCPPKSIGLIYFQMKVVLTRLLEERAVVVFKSIVPAPKAPFLLLLKSNGKEYEPMSEEEAGKLTLTHPLVVIEGVTPLNPGEFAELIKKMGLIPPLLALSALEAPFDRASKIEEVPEAPREEILRARENAAKEKIHENLELDHLFCASLEEVGRMGRFVNRKAEEARPPEEEKEMPRPKGGKK